MRVNSWLSRWAVAPGLLLVVFIALALGIVPLLVGTPAGDAPGVRLVVGLAPVVGVALLVLVLWGARRAPGGESLTWEPALDAQEELERIREAVQAQSEGVAIFNRADHLVYWNTRFTDFYPRPAREMRLGMSFEDLLRLQIREGENRSTTGREEDWVAERLEGRRRPDHSWIRQLIDQRWVRIYERRTEHEGTIVVVADVTPLMRAQHELAIARDEARLARLRLEEAIEALPAGFELWDENDRLVLCNSLLREQYPLLAPHLKIGAQFVDLARASMKQAGTALSPAAEASWLAERIARRSQVSEPIMNFSHENGRWRRIYERRTPSGHTVGIRLDITDLMERERELVEINTRLTSHEARLLDTLAMAAAPILTVDLQGQIVSANRATTVLFGYESDELARLNMVKLFGDSRRVLHERQLVQFLGADLPPQSKVEREVFARHRNGGTLALHLSIAPIAAVGSREFVIVVTDLSERKRYEDELRRLSDQLASLSTKDDLTGVSNRRLFEQRLQAEWGRSQRRHHPLSLLLIDIDDFKSYAEHHGRDTADRRLREIAQVIQRTIRRSGEFVARYGGEEFVILLPNTDARGAQVVARRCQSLVAAAQFARNTPAGPPLMSVSIGLAALIAPRLAEAIVLVDAADAALIQARRRGGNLIEVAPLAV
jgi:diguanylate cyclase (GGDEF)-like protein/PAS domain S-box-containing protein